MHNVTIQDVFERFLPEYAETSNFSDEQYLTTKCIMACRTAEMGAHVSECDSCHSTYIHYNSCKNRHCPMCQGMEVDEWIDMQQESVLDVTYFHTVFTIPQELNSLVYSNKKSLYDALYHAANKTLSELSLDEKYLGAKIGYICVLHTWGSRMNYHPHLHTIVLGGGLDSKNHWKEKNGKLFFPAKVLSRVFKKYYLQELKGLWQSGKLEYHGTATFLQNYYEFKALLNKLYDKDWVVHIKKAFCGAQSVIQYLGRYTHRIAISNNRIQNIHGDNVDFMVKDYKNAGKMIQESIPGTTFIRRFLMHVLPKGFVKIRYYGLLSNRNKKEKITLCRNLIGCEQYLSKLRGKSIAEKIWILYRHNICKCSKCGEPLHTFRIDGRYMLC